MKKIKLMSFFIFALKLKASKINPSPLILENTFPCIQDIVDHLLDLEDSMIPDTIILQHFHQLMHTEEGEQGHTFIKETLYVVLSVFSFIKYVRINESRLILCSVNRPIELYN